MSLFLIVTSAGIWLSQVIRIPSFVYVERWLWIFEPEQEDCVKGRVVHRCDSWLDSGPFTNVHPVQLVNYVYASKS
jgi:hypothetical protein